MSSGPTGRPHRRLKVILALAAFGGSTAPLPAQSTADVARMATPATVTIVTLDARGDTLGLGSGFVVTTNGVIVTNYHVMRGAVSAIIRFASGEAFDRVKALEADADHDVAVLKIPGYSLKVLTPAASVPAVGAKLIAIGAPRGLDFTVSEGIVSAVRMDQGRQWIQMTAPISPGSSGGPVLNDQGQVVGISTMYRTDGQSLNFAVPIKYAMGLVSDRKGPLPLASVFEADGHAIENGEAADSRGTLPSPALGANASWLADTYSARGWVTTIRMGQRSGSRTWSGLLLAADEDAGIMIWRWDDSTDGSQSIEAVIISNMFATDQGRVMLSLAGSAHQGYFTADGGMALAADTISNHRKVSQLILATPYQLDLTTATGRYTIQWQSRWYDDGSANASRGSLAWEGRGAFAFIGDSAYAALTLRNASGGTTAFYGAGAGREDTFHLTMTDGSELIGHVAAGQLFATFRDKRKGGSFLGQMAGRRQ